MRDEGIRRGLEDEVPFLARLQQGDRDLLLGLGRRMSYSAREVLLREHEPSGHVLVILHGWTKVTTAAANGYEALLALRGPGDLVGEGAALSNRPRSATVSALGPLEAQLITEDAFHSLLDEHPRIARGLLALTTDRTRASDRRRLQFAALNVQERLASVLLELARGHGTRTQEGLHITPPLTQQELAGSIGASREAVARLLKGLRDRGVVHTGRRGLVVVQPEVLRRISVAGERTN